MLRKLAAALVRRGFTLPEYSLSRLQELRHLRTLLRRLAINCVLDVGANRGQFARDLRDIGYDGYIVSFEPLAREFKTLATTFAGDVRWHGIPSALGDTNGTATLHVVPNLTVISSLLTPLHAPTVCPCEVTVRRLDELFPSLVAAIPSPRVLLKMDTQGYDLKVFQGARDCLDQIAALQSELSITPTYSGMPHYTEALSVYERHGFQLVALSLVSRTSVGTLEELNCLMERK